MIGAILARKIVRSAFNSLSQQNLDAFLEHWADDANLVHPGPAGPGSDNGIPTIEGKEAIREWYQAMVDEWQVTSFTITNICVKRHSPFVFSSNVATVEYELKAVTRSGSNESDTSGVSVVNIRHGRITELRNYECLGDPVRRILESKVKSSET